MSATGLAEVLNADCMEVSFPRYYQRKDFIHDAIRLRDLARLRTRQALTEAEVGEVAELRKRIRRADADKIMLLVIEARLRGGLQFF